MPSTEHISKVQQTILEAYGIEGSLRRLPGENLNYLVESDGGKKFVVKLTDEHGPGGVVEMEFMALKHAEQANPGIQFPSIIENKFGNYETLVKFSSNDHKLLRILNYIGGTDLTEHTDISEELRFDIGKTLASFDQSMAGFDHPAAHRMHRWDLAKAEQHEARISLVNDPEKRQLLAWAFNQFTKNVSPVLSSLPWQFIHGDANPENIRVAKDKVVGLLDFGDNCFNPLVCDLAICLAYQMMEHEDPCQPARVLVSGFQSVRPLSDTERSILLPLVCTRLAVTLSVVAERRQIDSGNANWFVSEAPAWKLLSTLFSLPAGRFEEVVFR